MSSTIDCLQSCVLPKVHQTDYQIIAELFFAVLCLQAVSAGEGTMVAASTNSRLECAQQPSHGLQGARVLLGLLEGVLHRQRHGGCRRGWRRRRHQRWRRLCKGAKFTSQRQAF